MKTRQLVRPLFLGLVVMIAGSGCAVIRDGLASSEKNQVRRDRADGRISPEQYRREMERIDRAVADAERAEKAK